jgi:hypothetical protein
MHAQLTLLFMVRHFSVLRINELSLKFGVTLSCRLAVCAPAVTTYKRAIRCATDQHNHSSTAQPPRERGVTKVITRAWSTQPTPLIVYQSRTWTLGVNPALF